MKARDRRLHADLLIIGFIYIGFKEAFKDTIINPAKCNLNFIFPKMAKGFIFVFKHLFLNEEFGNGIISGLWVRSAFQLREGLFKYFRVTEIFT